MIFSRFFICTLIIIFLFAVSSKSQVLSDSTVNFQDVFETAAAHKTIYLTNNSAQNMYIMNAYNYNSEFSVSFDSTVITAGNQSALLLNALPQQNILYKDFLVVETQGVEHPIVCSLSMQGKFSNAYYDGTENLWGDSLKQKLHTIISGQKEFTYSQVWNILQDTDEDPNNQNNVILLYTGWSYPKSNHGGNIDQWNREHVWAKSHGGFDTNPPAGTDVHHLRPTDVSVNAKRGNLDFDNGGSLYIDGDGATECRYDGDSWEPRDAVKGDVARMMYYMAVRYEGEEGYDLELVDYTGTSGSIFGKRSTLYTWCKNDPVDDWERTRNDKIYTNWQGNRNPFIDYPQFTDRLPSISGQPLPAKNAVIKVAPTVVTFEPVSISDTSCYKVLIMNDGEDDLQISSIISDNPVFTVLQNTMTIATHEYRYAALQFSASSEKTYNGTLIISSNDPDHPTSNINLTATAEPVSALDKSTGIIARKPGIVSCYPNPFNSTATIKFYLITNGFTTLNIYDIRGRLITKLISEKLASGEHHVRFDANDLPTGLYLSQLITRGQTSSHKLLLLR